MKNTTLKIITAPNELELVKKVNETNEEFFATQPIQKTDNSWVMFCYSQSKESPNNLPNEMSQEERKGLPATKPQINYLKKNNLPFKENITKQEAFKIISEHKK